MSTPNASPDNKAAVNTSNVSEYLQSELDEMNSSFSQVESNVMGRMTAMLKKMDDLEQSEYTIHTFMHTQIPYTSDMHMIV